MKNNLIKNISKLAGGTGLAQLLNIISIPILARLYSPEEFGYLAIFSSIVAILCVFSTLKFENAIIAAEKNSDAHRCVQLIFFISILISIIALGLLIIVNLIMKIEYQYAFELIFLTVIMSIFVSLNIALYYYNNRSQNYSVMTKGRVISAFFVFIVSIFSYFVFDSPLGLIYGAIAGSVSNFYYQLKFGIKMKFRLTYFSLISSFLTAKKMSRFPKYLVPSNFLDRLSSQMHIFLFAKFFQPEVLGALNLHNKVIRLPSSIIGNAVGDVFKKAANDQLLEENNCLILFKKTFLALVATGFIPFCVLFNYGEELYVFIFGKEWLIAGQFAEVLSILFYVGFVISPLSSLIYLGDNQKYDLFNQLLLVVLLIILLTVAITYEDPIIAIKFFMVAYLIKYIIEFAISYRIAKGNGVTKKTVI